MPNTDPIGEDCGLPNNQSNRRQRVARAREGRKIADGSEDGEVGSTLIRISKQREALTAQRIKQAGLVSLVEGIKEAATVVDPWMLGGMLIEGVAHVIGTSIPEERRVECAAAAVQLLARRTGVLNAKNVDVQQLQSRPADAMNGACLTP